MPKIATLNIALGFLILVFAASAGAFIATETSNAFVHNKEVLDSWYLMLAQSAHGHTNLFAMIHILFGLTIPYSALSLRSKTIQTVGFFLGTFAMSFLMVAKSMQTPHDVPQILDFIIGGCLSCTLCALASHSYGLFAKVIR